MSASAMAVEHSWTTGNESYLSHVAVIGKGVSGEVHKVGLFKHQLGNAKVNRSLTTSAVMYSHFVCDIKVITEANLL